MTERRHTDDAGTRLLHLLLQLLHARYLNCMRSPACRLLIVRIRPRPHLLHTLP